MSVRKLLQTYNLNNLITMIASVKHSEIVLIIFKQKYTEKYFYCGDYKIQR